MPFASVRISLQWPPAAAEETTDTLVLTSHKLHFVDIRITKPIPTGDGNNDGAIDWVITGIEAPIAGTGKVEFQHEINSHLELNSGEAYDVGDFADLPNGDRSETGVMAKPGTGKIEPYVEIWRSIDPSTSTPGGYVKETLPESEAPCVVYRLEEGQTEWLGQVVRIGNFAQGALLDKKANKLSCVRWFFDGEWKVQFQNGADVDRIVLGEDKEGSVVTHGGLQWRILESTF